MLRQQRALSVWLKQATCGKSCLAKRPKPRSTARGLRAFLQRAPKACHMDSCRRLAARVVSSLQCRHSFCGISSLLTALSPPLARPRSARRKHSKTLFSTGSPTSFGRLAAGNAQALLFSWECAACRQASRRSSGRRNAGRMTLRNCSLCSFALRVSRCAQRITEARVRVHACRLYAHVCSRMLTYAHVCYVQVLSALRRHACEFTRPGVYLGP